MPTRFDQQEIRDFLLKYGVGLDEDEASGIASEAAKEGQPIVETLCFQMIAEFLLASIHDTSWLAARAKDSDTDFDTIAKRILDAGVAVEDLAIFARAMQKEFLCNLGCLLDGSGIHPCPELPWKEFRIYAVDDEGRPVAMIEDLHEELALDDLETEMQRSKVSGQLPTD